MRSKLAGAGAIALVILGVIAPSMLALLFMLAGMATLFLATPIRFSGRVLQYLGRILRPATGKEKATVYDYVDEKVPALLNAAKARRRVYGEGGIAGWNDHWGERHR